MLKYKLVRIGIAATTLSLLVAMSLPEVASATGGTTGTGSCSDSGNTIGCVVGQPGGGGNGGGGGGSGSGGGGNGGGGGSGSGGGNGGGGSGSGGGGTTVPSCPHYVPFSIWGPPPNGQDPTSGAWYLDTCKGLGGTPLWIVNSQPPPPPPPDPATVGRQAASQIPIPSPTLEFSPAANAYVNFVEWLWIDPSIWRSFTVSLTLCNGPSCTTATASATPTSVTWYTGEPGMSPTICYGPGTPYNPSLPFGDQSTSCSHTYAVSSPGEPVKAVVNWAVSWSGPGGSGGQLASIQTSGTHTLPVQQIESVLN